MRDADAGLLARLLPTAPTLPGQSRFLTNTAFGDAYWLVGGRSLMLSSGSRVLRDVKEELGVAGDFAWTPAIVTALRTRIRAAGPASGPDASAWDREYVTPLTDVRSGDIVSLHILRCAVWIVYSREDWSQGPRVVQFAFETGVPRFGTRFSADSPPSVQTPTSVVDNFDPEALVLNPFTGQPGTMQGGSTTREDRSTRTTTGGRRSESSAPWILGGAILLAAMASGKASS